MLLKFAVNKQFNYVDEIRSSLCYKNINYFKKRIIDWICDESGR